MGGFRRFVLFVFSLAGLFCLVALALPWLGLFPDVTKSLELHQAYILAVEACLAMTAAWLLFGLCRALFSRSKKDAIAVMSVDGGQVTVAKSAVASQAGHIVEALGLGVAKDVGVRAEKGGRVTVDVQVVPYESVDITSEAPVLHEALATGLAAMCGDCLGSINIKFLEPQHGSSLVVPADEYDEAQGEADVAALDVPAKEALPAEQSGDITIPMGSEREA